jgi:hypothetical protein
MKKAFGGIICGGLLLAGIAHAQDRPEAVPYYTTQQFGRTWYVTQERLWKGETERNPHSEDAWLNYFKAARYSGFGDTTTDWKERAEKMTKLVENMGSAIPNTFTYHYVRWWNGGNDTAYISDLEQAYAIRQDYSELSDDFATYYELRGDQEKVKFFAKKWYETKSMAPALLDYNYNVLMSLEKNAILFTSGDNDTYPIWLLQYAKGIRPDVVVLNTSLVTDPGYRALMMKRYDIKGDASKLNSDRFATISPDSCEAEYLKSVAESNTKRPVYFALTCDPDYLTLINDNLYTVGLANRYSPRRIDNVAMLKKNWESFRLDYLDNQFYAEEYGFNHGLLQQIDMNYVTPALLLYEHYRLAGENDRAAKFRELALTLARQGGQGAEVEKYLAGIDDDASTENSADIPERSADVKREDDALGRDVRIVPNPASDAITIEMPEATDAEVQLVDMQGKVLRTMKSSGREIRMSTEGTVPGAYVVHITTPRGHFSKTVQIVR